MPKMFADSMDKKDAEKLEPAIASLLGRMESDGHALQAIALQIETAVAGLKEIVTTFLTSTSERQIGAIEDLRDHIDTQQERFERALKSIVENSRGPVPASEFDAKEEAGQHVRIRKELVASDSGVRFAILKDWVTRNMPSILYRASRGWATANELTANIPDYLEPEAEILDGRVLVLGTSSCSEKLALLLRDLDATSDLAQWFDSTSVQQNGIAVPAVLSRSNGCFELKSQGIHSSTRR